MEITLEKNDSLTASVKITLKEADYQDRIEKKIKEYARTAQIKGFRPGKVPPGMIRKMYGKSIKISEISAASTDALENYLRDNDIEILGGPMMSESTQNGNYDWDNQTEFEFSYDIGLKPAINLAVGKNIVIEKPSAEVTEEQIDATIENMRNAYATYENQQEVIDNPDVVIYGFLVTSNNEPIEVPTYLNSEEKRLLFTESSRGFGVLTLGKIGEHKSLFLGKKENDTVTFDLRTLFPSNEQVSEFMDMSPSMAANISGEFVMTISNITVKKLPELDEQFFKTVLGNDTIKDQEAFRNYVRSIKEREAAIVQKEQMINQFQNGLLAGHNFELPDAFMKRWLAANNPNLTAEQVSESYEKYRDTMRFEMLVNELAKQKGVKVEMQDVVDYLSDINFMQILRMNYFSMIGMEKNLAMRMLQDKENSNKIDDYVRLALLHKVFDACLDDITVR